MQSLENDRFLEKWARIRENKTRYILVRFVLLWGAISVIPSYIFGDLLRLSDNPPTLVDYLIRTSFFMLFGFVAGHAQCHMSENRYQELKK